MSRRRFALGWVKWVEAVAFGRQVEAKYALALKMLSGREARLRLQALSKAWRRWMAGRIQKLEAKEVRHSSLPPHRHNVNS